MTGKRKQSVRRFQNTGKEDGKRGFFWRVNTHLPSFSAKLQITYFPNCPYTNIKYVYSSYMLHMFMAAEMQRGEAGGG